MSRTTTIRMDVEQAGGSFAAPAGSAPTADYMRGVNAACKWLEKQALTVEEEKDGITWQRGCPQTFAWQIRLDLLPNEKGQR